MMGESDPAMADGTTRYGGVHLKAVASHGAHRHTRCSDVELLPAHTPARRPTGDDLASAARSLRGGGHDCREKTYEPDVADPARLRILVVDDTQDVRDLHTEYFVLRGYDVIQAADGRQALHAAFEQLPAIIVMDLDMPVMDGWTATRILKSDPRTKSVPIIVVTGNALLDRIQEAHDAGAGAVLRKPCAPTALIAAIEQALRGRASGAAALPPVALPTGSGPHFSLANLAVAALLHSGSVRLRRLVGVAGKDPPRSRAASSA